jgi:hypothetical protein
VEHLKYSLRRKFVNCSKKMFYKIDTRTSANSAAAVRVADVSSDIVCKKDFMDRPGNPIEGERIRDRIHNTSIYSKLMNESNKVICLSLTSFSSLM